MKIFRSRPAAAVAAAAALSLTATPVLARGWGGWGRYHHRDHVSTGDVLAGLLVVGGIAAIASAASNKNKQSRDADTHYPDPDPRADDNRYGEPPAGYGDRRDAPDYGASDRNLDAAVDDCVNEVERGDRRVDSVDSVNRDGDGWRVQGRTGGRDFSCTVDRDGRIRGVSVDGQAI